MAYEKRFYANSGMLFPAKSAKNPKAPDVTGSLDLGVDIIGYIVTEYNAGREVSLDLSGWKKVSRNGSKFISLKVREPYKKEGAPMQKTTTPVAKSAADEDDMEDGLPF
jgi:hypothetical protein